MFPNTLRVAFLASLLAPAAGLGNLQNGVFFRRSRIKLDGQAYGDVQGHRIPGHKGGSGAWELALRHSMLDLNSKQIQAGTLDDWTLALHWYLNPNFKVQWNVIWADRDVPGAVIDGETVCYGMRSTWAY